MPLVSLQTEANLPKCCRRDGKHQCSMKGMTGSGTAIQSVGKKCPLYPAGKASPALAKTGVTIPPYVTAAPVATLVASIEQTEARYRVSYSRASQKRGPPAFLLS